MENREDGRDISDIIMSYGYEFSLWDLVPSKVTNFCSQAQLLKVFCSQGNWQGL